MRAESSLARLPRWVAFALLFLVLCPRLAAAAGPARALELVTPADPVAARILDVVRVNSDGTRVLYQSIGSMPGASGGSLVSNAEAMRGETGWTTRPVAFPFSVDELSFNALFSPQLKAFSPDFSASVWLSTIPLTSDPLPEGKGALYRLEPDGGLVWLGTISTSEDFIGSSEDVQHVVFSSEEHLLAADAARTEGSSIYEVDGQTLRLVDVDEAGVPVSACGSVPSGGGAVSLSGQRIFFTSPPPYSSCGGQSRVYLREGGTTTVPVSESHCTRVDCNAPAPVNFAGTTPDGSTVFMTTTQQLVNADVDETRDLYAFDVSSGTLRLVSQSAPGGTGEVTGPIAIAEDGSSVYFYAEGQLLPGLGRESGTNLYRADEGGVHFVAPIDAGSPLQLSRSGQVAVFSTPASLEAADTDGVADVYIYDAADESVRRVSVGPDGGDGDFPADIVSPLEYLFTRPIERSLSDDGKEIFFGTAERLLPDDSNNVLDVYGWSENDGLELISPGDAEIPAEFASASSDGSTVVFGTRQSILPVDRDGGEYDLYAARVGGGFPVDAPPAECSGESCLGPPPPRVERGRLASEAAAPARKPAGPRMVHEARRAGSEIVEHGYTDIAVRVFGPGAVVARARQSGREKETAALRGVAGAVRPGTVTLRLRAAARTRQELRRDHILRLRLSLRQANLGTTTHLVLRWTGSR